MENFDVYKKFSKFPLNNVIKYSNTKPLIMYLNEIALSLLLKEIFCHNKFSVNK